MKPDNSHILTINGGSSSIKFALYHTGEPLEQSFHGSIGYIGLPDTNLSFSDSDGRHKDNLILESSEMFVRIAEGLGIRSILHTGCKTSCAKLFSFCLKLREDKPVIHKTRDKMNMSKAGKGKSGFGQWWPSESVMRAK